jgi:hypothetical protein
VCGTRPHLGKDTILRGEVSRGTRGRIAHEYDCKSRRTGADQSTKAYANGVGMPLVYVMGWFVARDHAASWWLWVELLGLAIYAAFAVLGLKKSPWFLVIGIAGHGFAWDSWHYKNSAYTPNWYAVACFLVDVTLAAYVAARVPAYKEAWRIAKKN